MSLFDKIVDQALLNQVDLSVLRPVVEKELLHHDILRILSENQLLHDLTFIDGTCLRMCYSAVRLSEDLDFTGGKTFTKKKLSSMSKILIDELQRKYDLLVKVSEPVQNSSNVNTWKIKVETRAEQKHLPSQRINIDICAVPSYEKTARLLINPYGVDMGTTGLVIQAQSREEIFTDKLLAFAQRPNRVKHRDLWDILWLSQQGIIPNYNLLMNKLDDRKIKGSVFLTNYDKRQLSLGENKALEKEFNKEMRRFLAPKQVERMLQQQQLWQAIIVLMEDFKRELINSLH